MRVAVTGGSGFIGSAVVRRLTDEGHAAVIIDKSRGTDVRHPHDVVRMLDGCDACIHLAGLLGTAELFDDAERAIEANVGGTLNVLRACEQTGAGYVGITMPTVFPSIYTATKLAATHMATAWHHAYGLRVSHVRAFNVFGPGQKFGHGHPQKILPTFATYAWRGEPIPIWGDGTQTVDLIHVADVARMLVDAIGHGDDVTFDAGCGVARSVNEVAATVLDLTGSHAGCAYLPMRRGEVATHIVATGEGWERLSWRPEPTPLAATVEWYRMEAAVAL